MDDVSVGAAVARVAVFVSALVLVAATGWTAGRTFEPPVPVPDLPTPAVFGGPGQEQPSGPGRAGPAVEQGDPAVVVPGHGHGR